jgi:hypothetical protein
VENLTHLVSFYGLEVPEVSDNDVGKLLYPMFFLLAFTDLFRVYLSTELHSKQK